MKELLNERQTAALLHVSMKSLQGWRVQGVGPPFVKLGRCVRYAVPDLEAALRTSTSDPGAAPAGQTCIRVEPLFEKTGCALGRAQATRPPRPRNRAKRLARLHGVNHTGAASGTLLQNQSVGWPETQRGG